MRKLVSHEERDKKRQRNQMFVVVVLGIILVLSIMGFALQGALGSNTNSGSNQGTFTYNGFQFTNNNGFWILGNFVFQNNPANVSNLSSAVVGILNGAQNYQNQPAYIYSEDAAARVEAYSNIGNIALRVQDACPSQNTSAGANCTENIPIKTCADNFIIIRYANMSMIKQDNGCVYIEGPQQDLVKLTDEFLYKILGVNK